MKIAVLTRSPKNYSNTRFREAAIARGHAIRFLDILRFSIQVEQGEPELFYANKRVSHYDAVVPRISPSITFFGTAVARQFEQMGVFTLNSSHAITVSRDKLRSLQVLSRHSIGMPPSAFCRGREDVQAAIKRVGGVPVIIKLIEGTQGVGVILAEKLEIAEAIIEALHVTRTNVLIQKFVAESRGKDIRALVVGGRVVAAMRRVAEGQEFRSNVHRGARAEAVDLDAEYADAAVKASQIMGLRVAGVDILESHEGPKVMEVNSSPGLEGIEQATGVDVAGAVIEHIEEQVLFPSIDLNQRLSLKHGYGVAEFPVTDNSSLAGRTLRETALRDRDVLVLSIDRNGVAIPNPAGDQEMLPGDRLLCYGKLLTLKTLVPPKPKRRRKKRAKPKPS